MMKFIASLFFHSRFYYAATGIICLFILGFFVPIMVPIAKIVLLLLIIITIVDIFLVYKSGTVFVTRSLADKLSNGDKNPIELYIESNFTIPITLEIIDELPEQFQFRSDVHSILDFTPMMKGKYLYEVTPKKRGEYTFGNIIVFVRSKLSLVKKKFIATTPTTVAVYPSYIQMRKYELMAISNRLTDYGIKKIRKTGQSNEFDQIKQYIPGDDYRTINWKATARSQQLMVNQYTDEKSQQIYCVIDKGRTMKMPFEGMTLLDYAINATVSLANVAIVKDDKAGLVTFSNRAGAFVKADKKRIQTKKIVEVLYNQKSSFKESSFELVTASMLSLIPQRSLLMFFTNFETSFGMQRQLPYLKMLSKRHLVVVVFFENTELREITSTVSKSTEEIYTKAIAESFALEKKLIVKELQQHGILTLLVEPKELTVNVINKYLEIKSRRLL